MSAPSTFARIVIAVLITLISTIGGCVAGYGIGHVLSNDIWAIMGLTVLLAFLGLLAGIFLAARSDGQLQASTSSDAPAPK